MPNYQLKNNLQSKLTPKINPPNQRLGEFKLNSPKTQWTGDVGWMVDCEVAHNLVMANSVNTCQISLSHWSCAGVGIWEKIF